MRPLDGLADGREEKVRALGKRGCLPACLASSAATAGPFSSAAAVGEIFSRDDQAWFLLLLRLLRFCPSDQENQSHLWLSTKVEKRKLDAAHIILKLKHYLLSALNPAKEIKCVM